MLSKQSYRILVRNRKFYNAEVHTFYNSDVQFFLGICSVMKLTVSDLLFLDFVKVKFGRGSYYLQRRRLARSVNIFNGTDYTLGLEWFPHYITEWGEDGPTIMIDAKSFQVVNDIDDKPILDRSEQFEILSKATGTKVSNKTYPIITFFLDRVRAHFFVYYL